MLTLHVPEFLRIATQKAKCVNDMECAHETQNANYMCLKENHSALPPTVDRVKTLQVKQVACC